MKIFATVENQITRENAELDPSLWWGITFKTCYVDEYGEETQCYSNAENYVQVNSEDATCESSAITLTKNPADSFDDLFKAQIGSS